MTLPCGGSPLLSRILIEPTWPVVGEEVELYLADNPDEDVETCWGHVPADAVLAQARSQAQTRYQRSASISVLLRRYTDLSVWPTLERSIIGHYRVGEDFPVLRETALEAIKSLRPTYAPVDGLHRLRQARAHCSMLAVGDTVGFDGYPAVVQGIRPGYLLLGWTWKNGRSSTRWVSADRVRLNAPAPVETGV